MSLNFVNTLMGFLIVFTQIGIILGIPSYLFVPKVRQFIERMIGANGIKLAFVVAITAMSGSLYYSNIAGFAPCELCWAQRIFMYPQVLLLGLAIYKKENKIVDYSLLILLVGLLISIYHNYIYYLGITATSCSLDSHTSCITPYVTIFNYISIPVMSLTAYLGVISLLLVSKIYQKNIEIK